MTAILVDGSNTLFWRGGLVDAQAPFAVVQALCARRFAPVVYFDNTIGRHLGAEALAALENVVPVIIAARGVHADRLLLEARADTRAQIVTNDRYQTWRGMFPDLRMAWLVTGRIGKGGRVEFSKKLRPAPL